MKTILKSNHLYVFAEKNCYNMQYIAIYNMQYANFGNLLHIFHSFQERQNGGLFIDGALALIDIAANTHFEFEVLM